MAEQALKVRTATNEALSKELACARSEKTRVEATSSAAQEESSFLADHMQVVGHTCRQQRARFILRLLLLPLMMMVPPLLVLLHVCCWAAAAPAAAWLAQLRGAAARGSGGTAGTQGCSRGAAALPCFPWQELLSERAALKEALEKAQRELDFLASENALLRQELLGALAVARVAARLLTWSGRCGRGLLLDGLLPHSGCSGSRPLPTRSSLPPCLLPPAEGAALGEESSAALQLLARQSEELRAAQRGVQEAEQRAAQLENENVQLQARVSGACSGRGVHPGLRMRVAEAGLRPPARLPLPMH